MSGEYIDINIEENEKIEAIKAVLFTLGWSKDLTFTTTKGLKGGELNPLGILNFNCEIRSGLVSCSTPNGLERTKYYFHVPIFAQHSAEKIAREFHSKFLALPNLSEISSTCVPAVAVVHQSKPKTSQNQLSLF